MHSQCILLVVTSPKNGLSDKLCLDDERTYGRNDEHRSDSESNGSACLLTAPRGKGRSEAEMSIVAQLPFQSKIFTTVLGSFARYTRIE